MREEVLVRFTKEDKEGIVAVGTYLMDAAMRLGMGIDESCRRGGDHNCAVKIGSGADLLSEATGLETELLSETARNSGERLACQAKIENPGEIEIVSFKKEEENAEKREETESDKYRKKFEELPLEKKLASLAELEVIALGETISYVINSPYEAAGKLMDVLAGFGLDMDKKDQESKKPEEHRENGSGGEETEPESSDKGDAPESDGGSADAVGDEPEGGED